MAIPQLHAIGQRLEAVGEAQRDQQRPAVHRGQPFGVPVQERRRAGPQVDRRIPYLAAQAADKLGLGMRRVREVHTAHGPARGGEGVIDLGDGPSPASGPQLLGAEQTQQEAARITDTLALHKS